VRCIAVKETHSTCPSHKLHSLAFSGTEQQKHQRSSGTELQDKCVCLLSAQKVRSALNGLFVPLVFVVLFLPLSPPSFTHSQELADCLELNSGISFSLSPPLTSLLLYLQLFPLDFGPCTWWITAGEKLGFPHGLFPITERKTPFSAFKNINSS